MGTKSLKVVSLPADWKLKSIGETCELLTGFPFKGSLYDEADGIKALRGENVSLGFLRWDTIKRWNHSTKGLEKYFLQKDDVVIGMDGSRIGKNRAQIQTSDLPLILAQRVARLRATSELDQEFLAEIILHKNFEKYVESVHTGTSIPHISGNQIKSFMIVIPPLEEQKEIADVLSCLTAKIRVNQLMNFTLETIETALFKRWFVDFEFPNQEGKPYKSTGGKMAYSEELDSEIPEGWEVKSLDEIAQFTRGFSYKGSEKSSSTGEFVFVTLNSIREGGGFKRKFSYLTSSRLKERHFVKEGDLVIANTHFGVGGSNEARILGTPALVEFPSNYNQQKGCFSHHITKVTPKNSEMKDYLYYHLQHYQKKATEYKIGSFIWSFDIQGFAKNELIFVPPQHLLKKFSNLIDSVFQKKRTNSRQSDTLSILRDTLLPKLMSGKIRIPINKENLEAT